MGSIYEKQMELVKKIKSSLRGTLGVEKDIQRIRSDLNYLVLDPHIYEIEELENILNLTQRFNQELDIIKNSAFKEIADYTTRMALNKVGSEFYSWDKNFESRKKFVVPAKLKFKKNTEIVASQD